MIVREKRAWILFAGLILCLGYLLWISLIDARPAPATKAALRLASQGEIVRLQTGLAGVPVSRYPRTKTRTLLIAAAENGRTDVVEWLLANGVDVNETNAYGESALHYAARSGHHDIVDLLIKHGGSMSAVDRNGRSALDWSSAERSNPSQR